MKSPEKTNLNSMNITEEKKKEMKKLFPEVFNEDKIDFEQLKRVLGEWVEPQNERFGLNWAGKAECMKIIQQPSIATLKPEPKESVDFDTTENLFIEGDNLEVLKLLQKSYFGKVKMIYIDPPYNTGKDILYKNNYYDNLEQYLKYTKQIDGYGVKFSTNTEQSGRYHSDWLSVMYSRVYLANSLLKNNGIFIIAIDHCELFNLGRLCDEIFGEENRLGIVTVVHKPEGRNQEKFFGTSNEYMFFYAKNKDDCSFNNVILDEKKSQEYNLKDGKGKYKRKNFIRLSDGKYSLRENKPNFYYPIYVSQDFKKITTKKNSRYIELYPITISGQERTWKTTKETAEEKIQNDELEVIKDNNRIYLYEKLREKEVIKTHWIKKEYHAYHFGTRIVDSLLDNKTFEFPKSIHLIKDVLALTTIENDIILDFFAGSGTTAHAVMQRNAEDQSNRKYICVQLPEPCDEESEAFKAGYKNIADIGKERIRRAGKKIKEENPDYTGDLGFQVFKLAPSNFKIWDGEVEKIDNLEQQLIDHVDHLNESSTPEDILYELLLKSGFELTTKIKKKKLVKKDVFFIEDASLLVCLEKNITQELIDAIAQENPLQIICLDEGFQGNDQLKANAVQTFKVKAQENQSEILFRTV